MLMHVKKMTLILAAMATFAGCDISYRDNGCGPGTNRTCGPVAYAEPAPASTVTVEVYYESCYDEPYSTAPEWCDWYDDGTTCCVWYSDTGWYEEYCQWEYDTCWDYNGSF
jgi:hypothetical protein